MKSDDTTTQKPDVENETSNETENTTTPPSEERQYDPGKLATDLKKQIAAISEKIKDSSSRSLIDRYIRLVSPTFADHGDASFPRTVRWHVRDHTRSQAGGMTNLLCFHIGNAILAYYAVVRGEEDEFTGIRLQHLKEIATLGPAAFVPYGDDATGYLLLTIEAARGAAQAKGE